MIFMLVVDNKLEWEAGNNWEVLDSDHVFAIKKLLPKTSH
jgi:hypothetical protein